MKLNDAAFDLSNGPVLDDVSGSLQCVRVRFFSIRFMFKDDADVCRVFGDLFESTLGKRP